MKMTIERIKATFAQENLPITKVRKLKDGWYIYHPFGSNYTYYTYKRTIVEQKGSFTRFYREKIPHQIHLSYISNESDAEILLEYAIVEAKQRRGHLGGG